MIRILFVDDEEMILRGLRRMLHGYRDFWDVSYATSGEQALELMEQSDFDVVVSDMRMPGMNGNELLAEAKKRHPSTVRIILSGHADPKLILDSTHHAHQYIAKPCSEEELKSAIGRCCEVRDLLEDEALVKTVSGLSSIPSLPKLYLDVVRVSEDESKSLRDVGDVVAKDVGMTAKILQLVNSSFFGSSRHIESMQDAMVFLGADTLKALVLSVKLFKCFNGNELDKLNVERIASHSLATGMLAQRIAKEAGAAKEVCDHALFAGGLHDIGQLILALNMPEPSAEIHQLENSSDLSLVEAENQVLGSNHARVGAYLLRLWGLPQPIVEAVAFHHDPRSCLSTEFTALTAVHLANGFEPLASVGEDGEPAALPSVLDIEYLEAVGVVDKLETWWRLNDPETDAEAA